MELIVEETALLDENKVYQAELINVVEEPKMRYGTCLRFIFRLINEPGKPVVFGLCSNGKLQRNAKLYNWLSIMNGSKLSVDEKIDPKSFRGCVVELAIKNVENDDVIYSNVSELLGLISPDQSLVNNKVA